VHLSDWRRGLAVVVLVLSTLTPAAADILFVSDFSGGSIHRFEIPSAFTSTIVAGLFLPEDGACHPDGRIYFAESFGGLITAWNQDGSGATNIVPAAGLVSGPEGLAFDVAGNLYFNTREIGFATEGAWTLEDGDPARPIVQIVAPFSTFGEGSDIVVAGPHDGALLLVARSEREVWISEPPGAPASIFIDSTGFPADCELFGVVTNGCGEIFVNCRHALSPTSDVLRFDPEGLFLETYASGMINTSFLDFDSDGNLYVADSGADTIWKVAPDKTRTAFAGLFGDPAGLAICRDERVPACGLQCDAGGPYLAECAGETTCLTLDGTGSKSADGGPLIYTWTTNCPEGEFDNDVSPTPELCVSSRDLGCSRTCEVTLTVQSGLDEESCTAELTVQDTLAPVVTLEPEACCLWPPNHKMVPAFGVSVVDACDPTPAVPVFAVTSDEHPSLELGAGGANHCPDAIFSGDQILLRAERSGTTGAADGRVYGGITLGVRDACGHEATIEATSSPCAGCPGAVCVPHDQDPKTPGQVPGNDPLGTCPAIDGGQAFDAADSSCPR